MRDARTDGRDVRKQLCTKGRSFSARDQDGIVNISQPMLYSVNGKVIGHATGSSRWMERSVADRMTSV